ncbi:MAG: hypothetical protein ACOC35_16150, partial [Promethearchaeia archaeon]
MSNREKFNSTIQEIKEIFIFLRDKEPTPDDEIEAREKLIEKFKDLKNTNEESEFQEPIEISLQKLENWDTLELWFDEVEGLSSKIEQVIDLAQGKKQEQKEGSKKAEKAIEEAFEKEAAKSAKESSGTGDAQQIDINQIVAQVSEQFKGTIDGLKSKVENLKKELEEKEKKLEETPKLMKELEEKEKEEKKKPP